VQNDTLITTNTSDGDPLRIHLEEGCMVEETWFGTTRKGTLENLDGEALIRLETRR